MPAKGYQSSGHIISSLGHWIWAERNPLATKSVTKKPNFRLRDHDEFIQLHKKNEQLELTKKGYSLKLGFRRVTSIITGLMLRHYHRVSSVAVHYFLLNPVVNLRFYSTNCSLC